MEESTIEESTIKESTMEIELWEDYLTLEIGPVLKYMQYPSFDDEDQGPEVCEVSVHSETDGEQSTEWCCETDPNHDKYDSTDEEVEMAEIEETEDHKHSGVNEAVLIATYSEWTPDDNVKQRQFMLKTEINTCKTETEATPYTDKEDVDFTEDFRNSLDKRSFEKISAETEKENALVNKTVINTSFKQTNYTEKESAHFSVKNITSSNDENEQLGAGIEHAFSEDKTLLISEKAVSEIGCFETDTQTKLVEEQGGHKDIRVSKNDESVDKTTVDEPRNNSDLDRKVMLKSELYGNKRNEVVSETVISSEKSKRNSGSCLLDKAEQQDSHVKAEACKEQQSNVEDSDEADISQSSSNMHKKDNEVGLKASMHELESGALNESTCKDHFKFNSDIREEEIVDFISSKHKDLYLEHFKGLKETDMKEIAETHRKNYSKKENRKHQSRHDGGDTFQHHIEDIFVDKTGPHIQNLETNYLSRRNEKTAKQDLKNSGMSYHSEEKQQRKKDFKSGDRLLYTYEKEVSFDDEIKFDFVGDSQRNVQGSSKYSRNVDSKTYRQTDSSRKERKIRKIAANTDTNFLKNKVSERITHSEKGPAFTQTQLKPDQTALASWDDPDTIGDDNKPYVHMTSSSNYAKRQRKSLDALTNSKSRRVKIDRGDRHKRGENNENLEHELTFSVYNTYSFRKCTNWYFCLTVELLHFDMSK